MSRFKIQFHVEVLEAALLNSKEASLTRRPMTSGKPHVGPNLGLLNPNLGHKTFFGDFSSTRLMMQI